MQLYNGQLHFGSVCSEIRPENVQGVLLCAALGVLKHKFDVQLDHKPGKPIQTSLTD